MSYRQGNNPNATSGADWQYSGAQVDPTANDQTSSGQQYGTNRTQGLGQTTPSSQQPQGGYSTHSNVTGNTTGQQYGTSQQYGDSQQTSDFGSTGQTQSSGLGQPQQTSGYNSQQGLSSQDPTSQQYSKSSGQQYGKSSNQQYGQPQSQSYGQHNPSLGEKVKGNFEKMAGQLQGDSQKAAQGEARAKGLDPTLQ
ncbi:hypothetical protein INT45_003277 [Circinella minor]|uniref:Uncharacterized protein n=1 Tax=Circinella minor TaxID=1195481 RepID=A0A8H7S959_9FUNG|nr:hypothetical protein INT45_003277 [Circinella minor]